MIGKNETEELNRIYNSNRARLVVVVYGRRRVGKTYLVNETTERIVVYKVLAT